MHCMQAAVVSLCPRPPCLQALCQQVEQLGADAIACIVTTTSCFAPRAADDVVAGQSLLGIASLKLALPIRMLPAARAPSVLHLSGCLPCSCQAVPAGRRRPHYQQRLWRAVGGTVRAGGQQGEGAVVAWLLCCAVPCCAVLQHLSGGHPAAGQNPHAARPADGSAVVVPAGVLCVAQGAG